METVLELRSVSKHFPSHVAVHDLSIALRGGEFFALLGPSGCGKTTTLRMIGGFEEPTSGEIFLNGKSLAGTKPYERDVTTVFQNYALFPHMTVQENIAFGLERRHRFSKKEIRAKAGAAIALVQLSGKERRKPAELSGGERQRVALARSLVLEPQVLLLDEPLSALDPKLRKQMRSELKTLQRRVGIAFLFITHDQEEALSLADRMGVMNGGRLEQSGTPEEVYRQPKTRFTAEFLGALNWINGAGIRPEALHLSANGDGQRRRIPGTVYRITFLGDHLQIEVELSTGSICTARVAGADRTYQIGDSVMVCWYPSDELHFAE